MLFTPRQKFRLLNWRRYERFVRALGPVFWLPLRETAGAIATNAAYTGGEQVLISDLLDSWSANDFPTGWTEVNESAGVREVNQVASGQNHANVGVDAGTGAVNFWTTDTAPVQIRRGTLQPSDTVRVRATCSYKSGSNTMGLSSSGSVPLVGRAGASGVGVLETTMILNTGVVGLVFGDVLNLGAADVTFDDFYAAKVGELDGAVAGTTSLAQTGLLGINEAFLFDGATSLITIANRANVQGLTDFTLWALFKPSSAGEGNAGTLFSKSGEFELRFNSASRDLIATVNYSSTNAQRITSTTLSANKWHTVGMRIDNSSKTPEIFVDGIEAGYASTTAGVGTRVSNTNNLIIGNNAAVSQTLAGLLDEALLVNRLLTTSELRLLHLLAGLD
jgi:hypothetical protein